MAHEDLEQRIRAAEAAVTTQGDTVRSLKAALKDKSIEKVSAHGSPAPTPPVPVPASSRRAACMGAQRSDVFTLCCAPQSEVDAAILKLKDLKAAAEQLQRCNIAALPELPHCCTRTYAASS